MVMCGEERVKAFWASLERLGYGGRVSRRKRRKKRRRNGSSPSRTKACSASRRAFSPSSIARANEDTSMFVSLPHLLQGDGKVRRSERPVGFWRWAFGVGKEGEDGEERDR